MTATPLRLAREAAGITLPRMAEIIGYDKGNLSRVESGQVKTDRVVEWVATRYEIALGLAPRSLVEAVGTLPRTLQLVPSASPDTEGLPGSRRQRTLRLVGAPRAPRPAPLARQPTAA